MNHDGYTIHALPCALAVGVLTVYEPFLLVAASIGDGNSDQAQAAPWQPVFHGQDPNNGITGSGICHGGFDGLEYAGPPEPTGSAVGFCLRSSPTLLYVATKSLGLPRYKLEGPRKKPVPSAPKV